MPQSQHSIHKCPGFDSRQLRTGLFTFLYFHLITSKCIYFQREARCSEHLEWKTTQHGGTIFPVNPQRTSDDTYWVDTTCAVHIEDCNGWWLSGCCGSVAEHWWLKLEVSWVRLPVAAGLFTFLYFHLITSKFTTLDSLTSFILPKIYTSLYLTPLWLYFTLPPISKALLHYTWLHFNLLRLTSFCLTLLRSFYQGSTSLYLTLLHSAVAIHSTMALLHSTWLFHTTMALLHSTMALLDSTMALLHSTWLFHTTKDLLHSTMALLDSIPQLFFTLLNPTSFYHGMQVEP